MNLKRRRFLVAGSTAALALSAGCVADGAELGAGNGDDGDDGDGGGDNETDGEATDGSDGDPNDEDAGTGGDGEDDGAESDGDGDPESDDEFVLVDHETVAFSGDGETRAEALYSAAAVDDALDGQAVPGNVREEIDAFVEETDFDRSVVLLIRARAPNLCYGIELEDVGVDEDGLTARARAVDDSADDEACAQMIHAPTLLVRAVFEDAVPRSGTIRVTDGTGTEHGFGYAEARESDQGSDREGDGDSSR